MSKYFYSLILIFTCFTLNAQIGNNNPQYYQAGTLSIGTTSYANSNAQLEIVSTNKGLLLPRVDSAGVVSSPSFGLIVYDKSKSSLMIYNGLSWVQFAEKNTVYTKTQTDSSINSFLANAKFGGSVDSTSNPAPIVNTYYIATQPAQSYDNMGNFTVNSNSIAIISYLSGSNSWSITQTPINLSNYIQKSDLTRMGGTIFSSQYIKIDTIIGSSGNEARSVGTKMYSKVPVRANTEYIISGWVASGVKNLFFYTSSGTAIGTVILVNNNYPNPDIITSPSNAAFVSLNIIQSSGQPDAISSLKMQTNTGGEAIDSIIQLPIAAKIITSGSVSPYPTTILNVANKGYVDSFTKLNSFTHIGQNIVIKAAPYLKTNTVINSAGTEATSSGTKMISKLPVQPNISYRIGGWINNNVKNFFWYTSAGVPIGTLITLNSSYPVNYNDLVSPSNAAFCSFNLVQASGQADPTDSVYMRQITPSSQEVITDLSGIQFRALELSNNNFIPDGTNPYNAVNNRILESKGMVVSKIGYDIPSNLADTTRIVKDKLVNSAYSIVTSAGWKMIRIPVSIGDTLSFGNFTISSGGYAAFYGADTVTYISGGIAFNNGNLPRTMITPSGASFLIIDIARPGDTSYSNLTINKGSTLQPYSSPIKSIISYDGKPFKSGSAGTLNFFGLTNVPTSGISNINKGLLINSTGDSIVARTIVEPNTSVQFTTLTANQIQFQPLPVYTSDAAADADSSLLSGSFYKIIADRHVYQKP